MSAPAVHLLIVGLIALLVGGLCVALFWPLWRRGKNGKGGKNGTPITEDMVKQKLAQIDLDL